MIDDKAKKTRHYQDIERLTAERDALKAALAMETATLLSSCDDVIRLEIQLTELREAAEAAVDCVDEEDKRDRLRAVLAKVKS